MFTHQIIKSFSRGFASPTRAHDLAVLRNTINYEGSCKYIIDSVVLKKKVEMMNRSVSGGPAFRSQERKEDLHNKLLFRQRLTEIDSDFPML